MIKLENREVWVTDDGRVFSTEKEAKAHEKGLKQEGALNDLVEFVDDLYYYNMEQSALVEALKDNAEILIPILKDLK